MGNHFVATAEDVATSASADTYITILGLLLADTIGFRARLRKLSVGCADGTPVDKALAIQVKRVDDVSAGGAGTATALTEDAKWSDPHTPNVAASKTYTVEPTTYGQPLWHIELNARGSIVMAWDAEDAPVIERDQLLGILVAPRDAAARQVSVHAEWEEF